MSSIIKMNDFWDNETINKSSSEELILEIEKKFEIILPTFFKKVYRISNGGYLNEALYFNKKHYEWRVIFLQGLIPLQEFETLKNIADTIDFPSKEEDWNTINQIKKLIVIARIGYSSFTCLDYRESNVEPKLVVYDTTLTPELTEEYPNFKESILSLKEEIFENNETVKKNETLLENNQNNIDLIINEMQKSFDISKFSNELIIEGVKLTLCEITGYNDDEHIKNISLMSVLKCAELFHKKIKE